MRSWWPDGQYTAPSDEALAFDVKAVKTFGLNAIRLHQKVNSDRWYWYADTLGVAVQQDFYQKYGGASAATVPIWNREVIDTMDDLWNHPSIFQWTVFNEGEQSICTVYIGYPALFYFLGTPLVFSPLY